MTVEKMWKVIQFNKEKISEWELIEDPSIIEEYLLIWTKFHHHQASASPSLHAEYGVSNSPAKIPANEVEYGEWLEEMLNTKMQMPILEVNFDEYKK